MKFHLLPALVVCSLFFGSLTAADYYVAPDGSDQSPGTKAAPFATLERARDALRNDKSRPSTVWIAGGDYCLSKPLELTKEDSGTADAPIIYRAAEGQKVRLLGARKLSVSDFQTVTDEATLARIPEAFRGKIISLDVKAMGIMRSKRFPDVFNHGGDLADIYFNGRRLPLSRFPNEGYMTIKRIIYNGGGPTNREWRGAIWHEIEPGATGAVFEYREEFQEKHVVWQKQLERGVWFKGYWRIPWQNEAIRVLGIDSEKRTVTFSQPIPGGVGNKYTRPEGNGKESYWILNSLEEVDQPGEWCIDFVDQKLYLLPPAPLANAEVLLSDFGDAVINLREASHIVLRGLTIEANCGDGISIEGGESNLVAGCTVFNVDRYGVRVQKGRNHTVLSCDLHNLGAGGVFLLGGDETSNPRVPAGHRVINNHIHHFSQMERIYTPGVNCGFTGGGNGGHHTAVGMHVAHNLIHDTPHAGVLFGSFDSVFEFNEVFRYATVSNDIGAFYCYDKAEQFGNITFKHNFLHSSDDGDGIYFDNDHPNMTVFGNIAYLRSTGKRGTSFLYKIGSQAKFKQSINCQNNIAVQSNIGFAFVSSLTTEGQIKNNVTVRCKTPYTWATIKEGKEAECPPYPAGQNTVYDADPGFVDAERFDFRLKPDAQLLKDLPDFQPIPFEKIGLFVDEYRTSLPTAEEIDREGKHIEERGLGYEVLDRNN